MSCKMYIHFHNQTDLPIMLSSWVKGSNILHHIRVAGGEKLLVHSSVGEWHMDSMLDSNEDLKMWKDAGLAKKLILGKFRSDPCFQGNYSWMEYDEPFDCIFTPGEIGQITFLRK